MAEETITEEPNYMGNEIERKRIAKLYTSSDPEVVLEKAESVIRDQDKDSDERMIAELAYVQIGIICPLANEFIEAAGLGGN